MSTPITDILAAVDLDALRQDLGVKDRSFRLARERRIFPASWYPHVKRRCDEAGIACPLEAFNWKAAE